MSYCRFSSKSDVYLYEGSGNYGSVWVCSDCFLYNHTEHLLLTRRDALAHLKQHLRAGHRVPGMALARLRSELVWEGRWRSRWRSHWPRFRRTGQSVAHL
jgi:hypothetical protein